MPNQARDRAALIRKLREQTELLQALGEWFDSGRSVVGLSLAVNVRTLVHNTSRSHALLAQLGELDTMPFLDTSLPSNPQDLHPSYTGLAVLEITPGVGVEYVPNKSVAGLVPGSEPRDVLFSVWWNTDIARDNQYVTWSRHKIIRAVADKEGGAHVDPSQPVDYRAVEEENSMGWTYNNPTVKGQPASNGPMLPTVRQIAYELERSIVNHLGSELSAGTGLSK